MGWNISASISQSVLIAANIADYQSELVKRFVKLRNGHPLTSLGLDEITPLGWLASLLILCGFGPISFSKAVPAVDSGINTDQLRSGCEKLIKALMLWDEESKDFPWEGLSSTYFLWTRFLPEKPLAYCQLWIVLLVFQFS